MHTVPPLPEVLSPLPHASQDVWFDSLAMVFSAQASHSTVAYMAAARPGGHAMQPTEPVSFAYDPGGQAS